MRLEEYQCVCDALSNTQEIIHSNNNGIVVMFVSYKTNTYIETAFALYLPTKIISYIEWGGIPAIPIRGAFLTESCNRRSQDTKKYSKNVAINNSSPLIIHTLYTYPVHTEQIVKIGVRISPFTLIHPPPIPSNSPEHATIGRNYSPRQFSLRLQ